MSEAVIICSSCRYLSPESWDECHHCGAEFRDDAGRSVSSLNRYYAALDAGYNNYPLYGYLLVVWCVVAIGVVGAVFMPESSEPSAAIAAIAFVLLGGIVTGSSMILGGRMVLGGRGFTGQSPPSRWKVLGLGALTTVVLAVVLVVVAVIPVVNTIASIGGVVLVLSSPYLAYRHRKRVQIDRPTAIAALFEIAVRSAELGNDSESRHNSPDTADVSTSSDGGIAATTSTIESGRDSAALATALNVLGGIPPEQVTEADRDVLREYLGDTPEGVHTVVTADNFLVAAANTHETLPESERERLLDRIINAARTLRSNGELDAARDSLEVAERLTETLDDASHRETCAREREGIENEIASNRFAESADGLLDLIRSAERALESGQYETALQRFRTVDERLASEFHGNSELESTHQELTTRLEQGLATATRKRLLAVLPDSPTDVERRLLDVSLPSSVANRLDAIYDDTLDPDQYAELFTDTDLNDVARATDPITEYRKHRSTVKTVTSKSRQDLNRIDEIIESGLNSQSETALQDALRAADLFVDALDQMTTLGSGDPHPALSNCLDTIRKELRTLQTTDEFEDANALVGMLESVDTYLNALPSLAIDTIVEEMTADIEAGAPLAPDSFEAQFDRIEHLVAQEVDSLADELDTFLSEWRDHPAVDARAWREAITEARETGDPVPLLDPYRTMQQMEGTMWTREELQRFSWGAFEQLVANLYERQGYETTVTSGSRDMGVDVWAENNRERVAIQVKQFAEGNTVGREVVQKLESTLARDDADRVAVVTSSTFANTATRYAAGSPDVELVDGANLVSQLTRHEVPASGLGV